MPTLDELFDMADKVTDKIVDTLKDAHHPEKDYGSPANATDAVIVSEESAYTLGAVNGPEGRGLYWHVFFGVSDVSLCVKTLAPVIRKRPNQGASDFILLCTGCVAKLLAFQTQSRPKELSDGHR